MVRGSENEFSKKKKEVRMSNVRNCTFLSYKAHVALLTKLSTIGLVIGNDRKCYINILR